MPSITRRAVALLLGLSFAALLAGVPVRGQQKEKKKKQKAPAPDSAEGMVLPQTDEQKIDFLISEVLGAWQIGDTERMHKNYAEDVSVVRGDFEPPILGWSSYEERYKQQRASMQQVRLDRSRNVYIKVNGSTAWACYQWEFAALVGGSPSAARGQTTYVLVKKDNRWLIVHDHTSVVQTAQPGGPSKP